MRNIIFILTLVTSFSLYAGECSRPEQQTDEYDSPIAYMEDSNYEDWEATEQFDQDFNKRIENFKSYETKLNRFLKESDDIKIQLFSFSSAFEGGLDAENIKTVLEQAINPLADNYTLYLADNICHSSTELRTWCHQQNIHQIHSQVDPKNVFTYLFMIHGDDDIQDKSKIISLAANNSTYSSSFNNEYVMELAEYYEDFKNSNREFYNDSLGVNEPFFIEQMQAIDKDVTKLQLIEKGVVPSDYQSNIEENASITMALGKSMSQDLFISHITNDCQQQDNLDSCLVISNLLKKDKSLMNQFIGTQIQTNVANFHDINQDDNKSTLNKTNATYEKASCFMQSGDVLYTQMLNINFMKKYIIDSKHFGELEASKKLAFKVYETEKKHGFNPDFNPKDCD